jgi:hypothetical protein
MTEHPDRAEVALRDTLERHAAEAPAPGQLMDRVRERRSRRRLWRTAGPVVLATATVVMVVMVAAWPAGQGGIDPAPGPKPRPEQVASRPADGWRWESYGGIEVQVPDTWTYGTTGEPPCLADQASKRPEPYVGRPGAVALIGCSEPVPELEHRSPYLWFGDSLAEPGSQNHGHGWVTETRDVRGVGITVFAADAALRERILDSAQPAGKADAYGCTPSHPNSVEPDARPKPGAALADIGTAQQIAICTYSIDRRTDAGLPLIAGSTLTGQAAHAAVEAILAAPQGSGPNDPTSCTADYAYGDQIMVLHLRGAKASADVVIRYGGCDHHGTDDGEVLRQLTRDIAQRVITGPHKPTGMNGSVADLIWGEGPDK